MQRDAAAGSVLRLDIARFLELPWTFHHGFLWWVYWLQEVIGWGLSALLVAVLSVVMKND